MLKIFSSLDTKQSNNNATISPVASTNNIVNNNATNLSKKPAPSASPPANIKNGVAGPPQIPWSSGSAGGAPVPHAGHEGGGGSQPQSAFFHREFPTLGAGNEAAPQYGPGPSLRPETKGSWVGGGGRGAPSPQDERAQAGFNGDVRLNRGSPPMGVIPPPGVSHLGGPPPHAMMGPPYRGMMTPYVSEFYFLTK